MKPRTRFENMNKKTRAALADRILSCVTSLIIDYQIDNDQDVEWFASITLNGETFSECNDK